MVSCVSPAFAPRGEETMTGFAASHDFERMTLPRTKYPFLIAICSALFLHGCDLGRLQTTVENATTATEDVLNDAINALSSQSSDWQRILQEAQGKLTADTQATVRNEIANVASRSVSQAGVEFRCDASFIGDGVREELIRIRANILGQSVPPVKPVFCQAVPIAIDREAVPNNVKQLEFYGYDFDHATDLRVSLMRRGSSAPVDVTKQLDFPTHYAITLKFGAGGVQLDDLSERFVLEFSGKQVSSVGVIQPQTPVCKSSPVSTPTNMKVTFAPPRIRGDADFAGHGPFVQSSVKLRATTDTVIANVFMNAKETTSDHTQAMGSQDFPIFNINTKAPGSRIVRIVSPSKLEQSYSYTDSDHANDKFELGSGGVIQRLDYIGDNPGDEAGTKTQVTITFNPITLETVPTSGCVSETAVKTLSTQGKISNKALQNLRLQPAKGL